MLKNKDSNLNILIILLFIILPIIMFGNIIFSDIMLYRGDGAGYLAGKQFIKSSLLDGKFPLWNIYNAAGTPFAADIQNAVFYPFNILILIFPVNVGFELYFALHLSLAAIGMYFYLKNSTKNVVISFVGGLILMFSNILIIRFDHINIMTSLAWVPFMLYMTDKLIEKMKVKYAILLGGLMALQFLAGFPQITIYSDCYIFLYFLAFSINRKIKIREIFKSTSIFIGCYFGLIAVQIVPLAQLISFSQRDEISYNVFIGYSQSWKMLLQLIFPSFWGTASVNLNSLIEFPTDIYLGIIPLLLCIYGIRFHFKDFKVKVYFFAIVITYLFASCGELPVIGKILYHIPFINSFRVPCRIIPLTVISGLSLAMYSLYLLLKYKGYKNYFKTSINLLTFSIGTYLIMNFMSAHIFDIFSKEYKDYYSNINLYLPAIFILVINIGIVYLFFIRSKQEIKPYFVYVFCVLAGIITIFDVYNLNKDSWGDAYRIQQLKNNLTEEDFSSGVGGFLETLPDKDRYRTILDYHDINEYFTYHADIVGNTNIFYKYMSLQSYITFQNPNFNGFFKNETSPMLTKNSLLTEINPSIISSLSAKYIVKKGTNPIVSFKDNLDENILYSETSVVELACKKNALAIHNVPIKVEKNKNYLVELELEIDETPDILIADLYGGTGSYDSVKQEVSLLSYFTDGIAKMSYVINSGESDIPEDTTMRIALSGNTNMLIKKLEVFEVKDGNTGFYKPIYNDGEYVVYENSKAKPILYVPQQVECVENVKKVIDSNKITMELENKIYTEDSKNYNSSKADISNINVEGNSVNCKIDAETDTFAVMTQVWYPGWKAYVDGEKVPIHLVNGLVQGIEVPKGHHDIEFKYDSLTLVIGGLISIGTVFIILLYIFRKIIKKYLIKLKG